ncbi:ergothioneine biosynthesis protein EgtB [Saccharospirillum salsuginis]|uniref:Ergothioneine biosynthesis protein EgtB n=1 Tax=Saccharospirillum salsuginis TaxID=418750 RepID=A0A918N547_9GAMM|nr:ergothioneine biosynthesis protein EgtB [Saccharospirillum salsuginis]GGX38009.1 ergothioneine biosynthesis protein EgtB [Saccharospirillum salsuginis]
MQDEAILRRLKGVRQQTLHLCEGLQPEDFGLQAAEFTSPLKWHLAHTTWFFETFVLTPYLNDYRSSHPEFQRIFNSYYQTLGQPLSRAQRHLQARPTLEEVWRYRTDILDTLQNAISMDGLSPEALNLVSLGTHHEQQHQELMLTDLKYCWSFSPLPPGMPQATRSGPIRQEPLEWQPLPEGVWEVGHDGNGFAFDNEGPRHRTYLAGGNLASRPVTNREYLAFMDDGGYETPALWLSDGWTTVQNHGWRSPLYWFLKDDQWWVYTLHGCQPLDPDAPVCHVSAYEAHAYATWCGARLPTEAEWETAAPDPGPDQGPVNGDWHPRPGGDAWYGAVWQWTASAYQPYPGFRPAGGAVGEYNGKFMCNQLTLRGSSCATPAGHTRRTYRNFFYPGDRWQFTGIRLAQDKE